MTAPKESPFFSAVSGAVVAALAWLVLAPLLSFRVDAYGLAPLVFCAGALAGLARLGRVLITVGAVVCLAVFVVCDTPVIAGPANELVRSDPPERADAVVVLSSGVNDEGRLDYSGLSRLLKGMELVKDGFSTTLVTTDLPRWKPSPAADRAGLIALLPQPITHETVGPVQTTNDEAGAVAALAAERGWKKILLVTSPLHSSRAAALFEARGLEVRSVPAVERSYSLSTLDQPGERFKVAITVAYESLARIKKMIAPMRGAGE